MAIKKEVEQTVVDAVETAAEEVVENVSAPVVDPRATMTGKIALYGAGVAVVGLAIYYGKKLWDKKKAEKEAELAEPIQPDVIVNVDPEADLEA